MQATWKWPNVGPQVVVLYEKWTQNSEYRNHDGMNACAAHDQPDTSIARTWAVPPPLPRAYHKNISVKSILPADACDNICLLKPIGVDAETYRCFVLTGATYRKPI